MLQLFPSNQRFALLARRSFHANTFSNNIGEKNKPSDTVADLNKIVEEKGEDGEKLKEEKSACQHFWWILRWRMGGTSTKLSNVKVRY